MKSIKSRIAILALAITVLAGLLVAWLIFRSVQAMTNALAERNKVGFVVGAKGVVFRTPNSELMAPAWNEPVTLADPVTFNTLFHSNEFWLGSDTKTVFMGEGRRVYQLENSQASTFRLLTPDGRFTCDAQHVYFLGLQLPKADPTSFKILGQFPSKDITQVYVGPLVLEGADPDTFQLENEGNFPKLTVAYSEGPCTTRKFSDDTLEVNGFHGLDKSYRFQGRINQKRNRSGNFRRSFGTRSFQTRLLHAGGGWFHRARQD